MPGAAQGKKKKGIRLREGRREEERAEVRRGEERA